MFTREMPTTTLHDVMDQLDDGSTTHRVATSDITVDLEGQIVCLRRGGKKKILPWTSDGQEALSRVLQVPVAFLNRLDPDLKQPLLTGMLERAKGDVMVKFDTDGVREMYEPSQKYLEPHLVVGSAASVLTEEAVVMDWHHSPTELLVDVICPEGFDKGIGGDRRKGDITRGGVRLGQNRKANAAPWVSPYLVRLVCTNGMEVADPSLKVSARGDDPERVLADFSASVERAFARVGDDIRHFYALRDTKVDSPERVIRRLASENSVSPRVMDAILARVPEVMTDDTATMFDVVNVITNQANEPSISRRHGARRVLERCGGSVVQDEATRCSRCKSVLS